MDPVNVRIDWQTGPRIRSRGFHLAEQVLGRSDCRSRILKFRNRNGSVRVGSSVFASSRNGMGPDNPFHLRPLLKYPAITQLLHVHKWDLSHNHSHHQPPMLVECFLSLSNTEINLRNNQRASLPLFHYSLPSDFSRILAKEDFKGNSTQDIQIIATKRGHSRQLSSWHKLALLL